TPPTPPTTDPATPAASTTSPEVVAGENLQTLLERVLAAHRDERWEEAGRLCDAALALDPARADAWTLRGMIWRKLERDDLALEAYRRAVLHKPDYADAFNNIGNLYRGRKEYEPARRNYEEALRLDPKSSGAWHNLALCHQEHGAHALALACLRQAVATGPDNADAHWDLALSLLLHGDLPHGFREYEWRWKRRKPEPRGYVQPLWDGGPLRGKTLYLYAEQGFGDALMFLRFLPEAAQRAQGRIVLEVQPELLPLLDHLPDMSQIIGRDDEPKPAFDVQAPLLSLPMIFGTTLETLPRQPFLEPPTAAREKWRQRLAPLDSTRELKVGLVWAGNPNVKNDAMRSPRLEPFLPILPRVGVRFFSLQMGDGRRDLEGRTLPPNFLDLAGQIGDFADTAGILANLDLLLTTDTSVAHLAGAMGLPGLVTLHHLPDWRWTLEPDRSVWNPTLKLFRQPEAERWDRVMAAVDRELLQLTAQRAAVGTGAASPPGAAELAASHFARAAALLAENQPEAADAACRQGLRLHPAAPDGWNLLGVIDRRRGALAASEAALRLAVALLPNYADAHHHLGRTLELQGAFAAAAEALQRACDLSPNHENYLIALANARREAGDGAGSQAAAQAILAFRPPSPAAFNLMGAALIQQGRTLEAEAPLRQAMALQPEGFEARSNLGIVLQHAERFDELAELFTGLSGEFPQRASVWLTLGLARHRLGQIAEAEACYEKALTLEPGLLHARNNLAALYRGGGQFKKALEHYQRILAQAPDRLEARIHRAHMKLYLCDWEGLDDLGDLVQRAMTAERGEDQLSPFPFLSFPVAMTEAQQTRIAANYCRSLRPPTGDPLPPRSPRDENAPLRIGYASSDFHNHATAHLMLGLFRRHDRKRFEIFAYSWGPDDASRYRQRIRQECDHFADLEGASSYAIARRIREDGIDILVDLKGHTGHSRPEIFLLHPAPVQATYLGYPGSFGDACMDFAIVDDVVTPPAQQGVYTECLAAMPHCYQINDNEQPIAEPLPDRGACGLPEEGFVFCCFCTHYKIDPTVFSVWMRILQQVPGSVLWLLSPIEPWAGENLQRQAALRGVDPARLLFAPTLPKERHLSRLRHADLFLDTLHYNAHTTASDALWAGVPVLTLPGATFASRVGSSIVRAVGLPELVMGDLAQYEAAAVDLATSGRDRLAALRERLAVNRLESPLFDTERFVRDLEALYGRMWATRGRLDDDRWS
ncbi:MAG: tetratricopeptide repeat protein, partial [Magnetococcales bacterium]|nr:tetratricopeptide repeat protein [Magnetococcales bacterium]